MGPFNPNALRYEVIRSLTGTPGDRVRGLGHQATVDQMIACLDKVYSIVATYDGLFRRVFEVFQRPKESIADYDSRMSRAFATLRCEFPERYEREEVEEKKRETFFAGLRDDMKLNIRFLTKQDPPADYDRLLRVAREMEDEAAQTRAKERATMPTAVPRSTFRRPWATAQAKQATIQEEPEEPTEEDVQSDEFDEETREEAAQIAMNASITAKRDFYKSRKPSDGTKKKDSGCFHCGKEDHYIRDCPTKNAKEGGSKGGNPPRAATTSKAGAARTPSQ